MTIKVPKTWFSCWSCLTGATVCRPASVDKPHDKQHCAEILSRIKWKHLLRNDCLFLRKIYLIHDII